MVDSYVDSIALRIDFVDKEYREVVFRQLSNFVKEKKIVAIQYDNENSTKYRQVTNLLSSNTIIAKITRSAYTYDNHNLPSPIQHYYLAISFFGMKRYDEKIDEKSMLLLKNIVAYLNTNNVSFSLTQLDIAVDIKQNTNNLLAVCINRKAKTQYHQLGTFDSFGKNIQTNSGTFEIEKFESIQKQNNVMKRAYLYDKRKKEIIKANNDMGFELSRFEVSFQNRFFLQNEVSVNSFLQALKDYKLFYFESIVQKEQLIQAYNKANNNKHRNQLIDKIAQTTSTITIKMFNVGNMLRMMDTIKFDSSGQFVIVKPENYLYSLSKFNSKKILNNFH